MVRKYQTSQNRQRAQSYSSHAKHQWGGQTTAAGSFLTVEKNTPKHTDTVGTNEAEIFSNLLSKLWNELLWIYRCKIKYPSIRSSLMIIPVNEQKQWWSCHAAGPENYRKIHKNLKNYERSKINKQQKKRGQLFRQSSPSDNNQGVHTLICSKSKQSYTAAEFKQSERQKHTPPERPAYTSSISDGREGELWKAWEGISALTLQE